MEQQEQEQGQGQPGRGCASWAHCPLANGSSNSKWRWEFSGLSQSKHVRSHRRRVGSRPAPLFANFGRHAQRPELFERTVVPRQVRGAATVLVLGATMGWWLWWLLLGPPLLLQGLQFIPPNAWRHPAPPNPVCCRYNSARAFSSLGMAQTATGINAIAMTYCWWVEGCANNAAARSRTPLTLRATSPPLYTCLHS